MVLCTPPCAALRRFEERRHRRPGEARSVVPLVFKARSSLRAFALLRSKGSGAAEAGFDGGAAAGLGATAAGSAFAATIGDLAGAVPAIWSNSALLRTPLASRISAIFRSASSALAAWRTLCASAGVRRPLCNSTSASCWWAAVSAGCWPWAIGRLRAAAKASDPTLAMIAALT